MNQIVIDMFTRATMFLQDEDMTSLYDIAKGTTIIESPRGESVGGTNYWVVEDPRPTKAEARAQLDKLWYVDVPLRILRKSPVIRTPLAPVLFAPELADVLIEIDPLDRLED